jgi:hypothetical protein
MFSPSELTDTVSDCSLSTCVFKEIKMKVTKTTKASAKWMTLRAGHARMGRTVLQLLANPDSKASDISAAAEMYREVTTLLEAEYATLNKTINGTYLPVLTHRGHNSKVKVIIRHKPNTNV